MVSIFSLTKNLKHKAMLMITFADPCNSPTSFAHLPVSSGLLPVPDRDSLQQHMRGNDVFMRISGPSDQITGLAPADPYALPAAVALSTVQTDGLVPDRICAEHADIYTVAADFGAQAMLLVLFDDERTGIDHFPRDPEGAHQNADVPIAVADHEMPLAGLHTEVQGMDQAGIPTPFENGHRFISADDPVTQIQVQVDFRAVQDDDVLAGRFLPPVQRLLTHTGSHRKVGCIFFALQAFNEPDEIDG